MGGRPTLDRRAHTILYSVQKATHKKNADILRPGWLKALTPPPFTVSFLWFFCECSSDLILYFIIVIICVLKRILHKKKSISMQLLESPIPPLTAAALWMIICKRLAPTDDHLQVADHSGWWFARGWSLWMIICKRLVHLNDHLQEAGRSKW